MFANWLVVLPAVNCSIKFALSAVLPKLTGETLVICRARLGICSL